MDERLTTPKTYLPVTLALACALEDCGDLFAAARAVADSGQADAQAAPLGRLLCDIIAPLLEMGGFYTDAAGCRKIDRQALCDFAVVACGLSRHAALYEITLHELALHHRRLAPKTGAHAAPSSAFLAEMQALFPDDKG